MCIIEFSININKYFTLDRHSRSSHQTIQLFTCWLSACHSDTRVMSRLQRDGETFLAMRHCCIHSFHIQDSRSGTESHIVVQTTINLERCCLCAINLTIARCRTHIESCHLHALTHLKVIILTEDITWVLSSGIMVECDILETGIAKNTYILHTVITILVSLNSTFIIHSLIITFWNFLIMQSCDGHILCKVRGINLSLPFSIRLWRHISLKTSRNRKTLIFSIRRNIACSVSVASSYQDNHIMIPCNAIRKQFVCPLPCSNRMLIVTTLVTIITRRIACHYVITCWMQEYNIFINNPDCQFRYKWLWIFWYESLIHILFTMNRYECTPILISCRNGTIICLCNICPRKNIVIDSSVYDINLSRRRGGISVRGGDRYIWIACILSVCSIRLLYITRLFFVSKQGIFLRRNHIIYITICNNIFIWMSINIICPVSFYNIIISAFVLNTHNIRSVSFKTLQSSIIHFFSRTFAPLLPSITKLIVFICES